MPEARLRNPKGDFFRVEEDRLTRDSIFEGDVGTLGEGTGFA